mmetsp:Transcript_58391/g.139232  ORF Transcript_58391/g.139232 Transcript_58391/m.139232 type:complete len:86 (-) Transcript_58391:40-297(-)
MASSSSNEADAFIATELLPLRTAVGGLLGVAASSPERNAELVSQQIAAIRRGRRSEQHRSVTPLLLRSGRPHACSLSRGTVPILM